MSRRPLSSAKPWRQIHFTSKDVSGELCRSGCGLDAVPAPALSRQFDELLRIAGVQIMAVTPEQGCLAREAYRDFGRGSGHPARLNFGDCFAYALSKTAGEPLLFKGNDLSHTDIEPVTY